jgi:hypothetical protein
LGGIARTRTATTLDEAAAIIAGGVDLIIAGTYFDGSRMFDLLRLVKECDEWRDIPFVCVRGLSSPALEHDDITTATKPLLSNLDVVDSASKALGAVGFVDLCDRGGAMRAQSALTQLALACLN